MNQILSMDPNNPSFGNNYNNYNNMNNGGNNGGNNGKLSNKTTKRIFAIGLILFGLVMFVSGLIGVINYFSTPQGPVIDYPIVSTMQNDNILTLNVKNDIAIDVIQYKWNEGRAQEIEGNGLLEITRDITVPEGENILYLTLIDMNGKITEMSNSFVGKEIEDTTPPEIEVVVVSSKLNITAKSVSETKLSYLTYKWNDEEEIRIEATGDQKSIETTLDVLNGTNTLTIVAVNEKGISQTQVNEYKGIKKPVISVIKDETGNFLLVTITHDAGVKSADVTLNDRKVSLTADQFGADKPVVEFRVRLKEQSNNLKIIATSMDDSVETFNGVATKGN